ncbi:sugar ABC transporter ATP-binding protein [Labrys monachus]|uniref:Ribose transport system ATP-binding protein n=1 Tax=Labrys monachus TaxID=217067 RepID=A0ABU0FH68_9HYPH|nr:sugar ABC transporter ATP-binding protein [Labrys monachus]MDQ0393958.1 ribose transport system ATP-binding protein [Labrys monachus]
MPPHSTAEPAVAVDHVGKAYGATIALDDVGFSIEAGSAHALLGENGAGKSTLVKLLSGLVMPDSGTFRIFGEPVRLTSVRAAHAQGLQTAFQEMTLVRDLTVLDNMLIPYAPMNALGLVRRRHAARQVEEHFAAIGLDHIDLDEEIRDLDLAVQQKIEVARALFRRPMVLLLDEPTSTLSGRDVDWLGAVIAREQARGTTVVFISHRLREVRDFCSRVTVLRNGRHIATGNVGDYSDGEIISMIAGRSFAHSFPARPTQRRASGAEVLRADGIGTAGKLVDASFRLHAGEILGVAGLQGMGQLELFLACFGMAEIVRGQLSVDGQPVEITSPREAVRADVGISLVPEDRKTEALFLKLGGGHNASLPVIERFTRFGLIDGEAEKAAVARVFERVDVDRRALWTPVSAFSGGNQQKIAIAKWLLAESRCLLLYDPTRGIDVGTKNELYRLIRAFADAGGAVLFYSTEIPEIVHLADRAIVFYGGRVAAGIEEADLTEEAILKAALGSAEPGKAAA